MYSLYITEQQIKDALRRDQADVVTYLKNAAHFTDEPISIMVAGHHFTSDENFSTYCRLKRGLGLEEECSGGRQCLADDNRLILKLQQKEPAWHICRGGLWDAVVPLRVEDQVVAYLFTGQFRPLWLPTKQIDDSIKRTFRHVKKILPDETLENIKYHYENIRWELTYESINARLNKLSEARPPIEAYLRSVIRLLEGTAKIRFLVDLQRTLNSEPPQENDSQEKTRKKTSRSVSLSSRSKSIDNGLKELREYIGRDRIWLFGSSIYEDANPPSSLELLYVQGKKCKIKQGTKNAFASGQDFSTEISNEEITSLCFNFSEYLTKKIGSDITCIICGGQSGKTSGSNVLQGILFIETNSARKAIEKKWMSISPLDDREFLAGVGNAFASALGSAKAMRIVKDRQEELVAELTDVGHQLNVPLHALKQESTLLSMLAVEVAKHATYDIKDKIARTVRRLNSISDLAAFAGSRLYTLEGLSAKISAQRVEEFSFKDCLLQCQDAIQPRLDNKGRKIIWEKSFKDCNEIQVLGDQDLLKQAILNLLDNAAKYASSDEIIISLEGRGQDQAKIGFYNTCYFSVDEIDRFTERRFRSESVKRANPTGTGLGLTIVYRIAKYLNGDLDISPRTGDLPSNEDGIIFTLTLPCK